MKIPDAAGLALAVLMWMPAVSETSGPPTDSVWSHPDLAQRTLRQTALLPVADALGDPLAPLFVENRLPPAFCSSSTGWMLPNAARRQLVRRTRRPWTELDSLSARLWRDGGVDSLAARDLARRLGVQSVLGVHIRQWERRASTGSDAPQAFVSLQAALVDSDGVVLWRAEGENRARTTREQQVGMGEAAARAGVRVGWGVPWTGTDPCWAPDFDRAVSGLLARWRLQLPVHRTTS